MIPLYIDEHVPRAITTGVRLRGVDVLTVQEDGLSGLSDPGILDRAAELRRVVFTMDSDFLTEAAHRRRDGRPFPGVIFAHHMKTSIGQCVKDLELLSRLSEIDDMLNQVVFLPL